jgi:hypothetical protein
MPHPRRRFIQQFALASVALALGRAHAAPAGAKSTPAQDTTPGYSTFAALVGREFSARHEASPTTSLELAEVVRPKSLRGHPDAQKAREQCFTLIFRGEAGQRLPQGIYRLDMPGLAGFDAFMSPVGGGDSYQVVFNRI